MILLILEEYTEADMVTDFEIASSHIVNPNTHETDTVKEGPKNKKEDRKKYAMLDEDEGKVTETYYNGNGSWDNDL